MMKYKIFSSLLIFIFLISIVSVSAQDKGYTQEDANNAGLLPDSAFYPLKIAIQRITELFGENIKLKHAEQRLSEIKVMTALGMENQTEKSMKDFDRIYDSMKNTTKLTEQKQVRDNLGQKISAITSVPKGNMTAEEKQAIRDQVKQLITEHKEAQRIKQIEAQRINQIGQCKNDNDCPPPNSCVDICYSQDECPHAPQSRIGYGICVERCYIIVRELPQDGGRAFCEITGICHETTISYKTLQDCINAGGIQRIK